MIRYPLEASHRNLHTHIAGFVAIGITAVVSTLIIHELGHAVAAVAMGGEVTALRLWGFTIFPEFSFSGFEGGYLGYTNWTLPVFSPIKNALILMMGSGTTLIVSLVSIKLLYVLKPRSFVINTTLFFFALTYLDIVTYSFGLRFSASREPLDAALTLGIGKGVWLLAMVALLVACSYMIILYYIRKIKVSEISET